MSRRLGTGWLDVAQRRRQGAARRLGAADGLGEDRLQVDARRVIAAGAAADVAAVPGPRDQAGTREARQVALDLHEARPGEAGELALTEVIVGPREEQPRQADKRGRGELSGGTAVRASAIHMTMLLGRLTKTTGRCAGGLQFGDRHGTRIGAPPACRKIDNRVAR